MEEKSLEAGEKRIKFSCRRIGNITELLNNNVEKEMYYEHAKKLADALLKQEQHGLSPILPDGKIGGNGALKIQLNDTTYVLVTKSGKNPGEMDLLKSMCLVKKFDKTTWSCEYYSEEADIKPTCDTPMHYCLLNLQNVFDNNNMAEYPTVAIHGHALASVEEAEKLNLPYSRETLCSTPEDTEVMVEMLHRHTYPQQKVFIRLNHGYYILGRSAEDCVATLINQIVKHL